MAAMDSALTELESHGMFGGTLKKCTHLSTACACDMTFYVYLPPPPRGGAASSRAPLLLCLGGLTASCENFATKVATTHAAAAAEGVALVFPDTSPRGAGVPDDDHPLLGYGASYYVDATREPWARHYRMFTCDPRAGSKNPLYARVGLSRGPRARALKGSSRRVRFLFRRGAQVRCA